MIETTTVHQTANLRPMTKEIAMNWLRIAAAGCCAALAAGCATPVYDGRFAWSEGWREGTVIAVGEGPEFTRMLLGGCDAMSPKPVRYARVRYIQQAKARWRTAPMQREYRVGDPVYLKVGRCSQLEPRVAPSDPRSGAATTTGWGARKDNANV